MACGPLYAEWPNNQPGQFNAPKIGDFPPENIDELLKQGNPDFSPQSETVAVEVQPTQQHVQQPVKQAVPSVPALQPSQQSGQQTGQQATRYATQQPAYGTYPYPYAGQGWNRGYGHDRSWGNGTWRNGSWNSSPWSNRGGSFNMPWGNNRSGLSPWNGSWGGNNWGNRRNYNTPWNYNASGFNMPWGNNNSGFSPFGRSW